MGTFIEIELKGWPVPSPRMTRRSLWTDTAQNYLAYKNILASLIKIKFPGQVLDIPPTSLKKERTKFLKEYRDIYYKLRIQVFEPKETGDWDNYGKTVSDALQDAQVIVNDKKIKDGRVEVFVDPDDPRVWFRLEELP